MTQGRDEEIRQLIHAEAMSKRSRLDSLLRSSGQDDLADELKGRLRGVDLGLEVARATWDSLSKAQRRILLLLSKSDPLAINCLSFAVHR